MPKSPPAPSAPLSPTTTATPDSPPGAHTPPQAATPTGAPPVFPGYDDSFTHKFQLPSHGLPYIDGNGQPLLPDDGSVIVRMMTGEEEAILNSDAFNDTAKIAKIVQACTRVVTVGGTVLNTDYLITTDRLMLILFIRSHSLGAKYKLPAVCPARGCGCEFEHEFDLLEGMDVEEMPREHQRTRKVQKDGVDVDESFTETLTYDPKAGIEVTLPLSNYAVRLRLLTGKDEDWIAREVQKGDKSVLRERPKGDPTYFLRMVRMIREIRLPGKDWTVVIPEAAKDINEVCSLIRRLPIRDTNKISKAYMEHDVGISNVVEASCPTCGGEVFVPFRFLNEFFRPTNRYD